MTIKWGDQQDIDQLTLPGRLKQWQNTWTMRWASASSIKKGWKGFAHSGADAGYRTILAVFPEKKLGFLVFSNLGDFNPAYKAMAVADLFLTDKTNNPTKGQSRNAGQQPCRIKKSHFPDKICRRLCFRRDGQADPFAHPKQQAVLRCFQPQGPVNED